MTRLIFTNEITLLLQAMIMAGERVVIDYVKRSDAEQKRLFARRLSRCDGKRIISKHQTGTAMDIYFITDSGEIDWSSWKYKKWHEVWQKEFGGREMITWDVGHFE